MIKLDPSVVAILVFTSENSMGENPDMKDWPSKYHKVKCVTTRLKPFVDNVIFYYSRAERLIPRSIATRDDSTSEYCTVSQKHSLKKRASSF